MVNVASIIAFAVGIVSFLIAAYSFRYYRRARHLAKTRRELERLAEGIPSELEQKELQLSDAVKGMPPEQAINAIVMWLEQEEKLVDGRLNYLGGRITDLEERSLNRWQKLAAVGTCVGGICGPVGILVSIFLR